MKTSYVLQQTVSATSDDEGASTVLVFDPQDAELQLHVEDSDPDSSATLDVYVQTSLDGTKWTDVAHFTQVIGDESEYYYVLKLNRGLAQAGFELDASLSANAVRHILGRYWRVRHDTDGMASSAASFTYNVKATFTV